MNAIQFIKDHGVEKAREVVEGAPARANWYQIKGKYSNDLYSCNHELYGEAIMLSDLKRLVESVELVEKFGDLEAAKAYVPDGYKSERLKQAIADYEAIYSNDCEILDHPEDYTSPNCKKFDEQVK